MRINWQNLGTTLQNAKEAYEAADLGRLHDDGAIGFYDHPMSDLAQASNLYDESYPDTFIIGTSKWGQNDLVDK